MSETGNARPRPEAEAFQSMPSAPPLSPPHSQSVSPSSLSQSAPSYSSGSIHGKAASETVYAKSKGPSHRPALAEAGAGIEDGVCILVCGEAGVGKTAIIDTLFSRSFRSDMDRDEDDSLAGTREDGADWSECQIPGQLNTPRGIPTTLRIIDTRSREAALHKLHEAHAIVLVYDVGRPRTFNAATDDWLQALKRMADLDYNRKRRSTRMLPVVLVGNKIDVLAGDNTVERDLDLEKKVIPVLKAHREVEACLECSARAVLNIRQVFYYAQKAVVYPIQPLYNMELAQLSPQFTTALKRIFRIFDADRDFELSDDELNLFQFQCFAVHLESSDIQGIKKMLRKSGSALVSSEDRVTLEGFLFINKEFIERNRPEHSWNILSHFGYERSGDDELCIMLDGNGPDRSVPRLVQEMDQSTEMSPAAVRFISQVFHQYAKGGLLTADGATRLFEVCPEGAPWLRGGRQCGYNYPRCIRLLPQDGDLNLHDSHSIDMESWMALWSLVSASEPQVFMRYMWFLGFPGEPLTRGSRTLAIYTKWPQNKDHLASAISITPRRSKIATRPVNQRRNIRCYVFGSRASGKELLLAGLVCPSEADFEGPSRAAALEEFEKEMEQKSESEWSAVRWINAGGEGGKLDGGKRITAGAAEADVMKCISLTMTQWPASQSATSTVAEFRPSSAACDVACLVFRASEPKSLTFIRTIQKEMPDHIPCVYVAMIEGGSAPNELEMKQIEAAKQLCTDYELEDPLILPCGLPGPIVDDVLSNVLLKATRPSMARPISREKRAAIDKARKNMKYAVGTVAAVALCAAAFLAWRWYGNPSSPSRADGEAGAEAAPTAVAKKSSTNARDTKMDHAKPEMPKKAKGSFFSKFL
eukprot:g5181.t1